MTTYVWRNGDFVDKRTGKPMEVKAGPICAPMVMSDIPEYHSPIDGRVIGSRSERREDLRRNNCFEVDPPRKPRGLKNPAFAKKHGLPLNEELFHAQPKAYRDKFQPKD